MKITIVAALFASLAAAVPMEALQAGAAGISKRNCDFFDQCCDVGTDNRNKQICQEKCNLRICNDVNNAGGCFGCLIACQRCPDP